MSSLARVAALAALALIVAGCSSDDDPTGPGPNPPSGQPAPVADLAVTAATDTSITLDWTTPGVPGDDRALAEYDLRRAALGEEEAGWDLWQAVALPAPAAPGTPDTATVGGLAAGSTWVFRLRSRGTGLWSELSGPVVATAHPQWDQTPPAPVDDLTLRWRSEDALAVAWSATGDDAGYGEAASYEGRHADAPVDAASWDAATVGPPPVFDQELELWTCQLAGLGDYQTVHVAVRAADDAGNWSDLSNGVMSEPPAGHVWHVREDGSGTVPTIAEGIRQAGYRALILVHPGRYTATNQGFMDDLGMIFVGRDTTDFTLASAEGPEVTILDAEGQGCVIFLQSYNDGVVIDGFTITGGANPPTGDPDYPLAGGLTYHLTSPTVRNCIFEGNNGGQGGAIGFFGVGTPLIEHCIIRNNHATRYGGAVYAVNVHGMDNDTEHGIALVDCVIEDNTCDNVGGGICFLNAVALVEDCVIAGNAAATSGGGVIVAGRSISNDADTWVRFVRTTIAGNTSPLGAAIRVSSTSNGTDSRWGHARWTACIVADHGDAESISLRENTVLEIGCSDLYANAGSAERPAGATDLGDNFWLDPLFCGPGALDPWALAAASPCLAGAHPDGADCGRIGARDEGCSR